MISLPYTVLLPFIVEASFLILFVGLNSIKLGFTMLYKKKNHNLDTYYGQTIYCFHKLALIDRGYSVKIGISLIYEKDHLLPPIQIKECEENIVKYSKYLFRFKDNKPLNALKAIIKITTLHENF